MSDCVIGDGICSASLLHRTHAARPSGLGAHSGVGMLEFLLALLIFSTGMMGLMSAQLAGKRASFEASQRSYATALARDVLERMRANPRQLAAYRVAGAGDASERRPPPDTDCDANDCTAAQLAAFDLWQWEALLLGESEQFRGDNTGGLVSPRACITREGAVMTVAISWLGVTPAGHGAPIDCGDDSSGVDESGDEGENSSQRRQLTIATFIAG